LKPLHWIVIFVLLILLFGANKLPDVAASLGQSLKVFKKEVKELREEDDAAQQKPPAQIQQPQEGTYYTQPTQPGQAAPQPTEAAPQSTDDAAPRA
jgi:hypothetical protein